MGIHSDSIYKDAQREVEAEKVDTEELSPTVVQAESSTGQELLKLLDSTGYQMGHIEINQDSAGQQGEALAITMDGSDDRLVISNPSNEGLTIDGAGGKIECVRTWEFIGGIRTVDDNRLKFGSDDDFTVVYDSTDNELVIKDATNGFEIARLTKNGGLKHTPRSSAPSNPEQGVVAMADGVNWDPGSGSGLYLYDGGAWQYLGGAGTV